MGSDKILCRDVLEYEWQSILVEAHAGVAGGHYAGSVTMQKILRAGLWWPIVHKDSNAYCRMCDTFQRIGRPLQRDKLPLNMKITLQVFDKSVINFVGPI